MNEHHSRRTFLSFVGAGIAAPTVLTSCTSESSGTGGGGGADGATLNLALSGEPSSFDPALQVSAGDAIWLWHAVYDALLRTAEDGSILPGAAESWELSDDATVLTMTLREGMTFSDGSPVDSAAAAASIEHMRTGGGTDAGRVADLAVETPDERTVVVTAPVPTGQLPTFMTFAPGIVASPAQLEAETVGTVPVSSGPYELDAERTTSGSVYTFTKRDDYWDAGTYPHDTLVLTVMPDVNARLNALRSGQLVGGRLNQASSAEAEAAGLTVLGLTSPWAGLYLADRAGAMVPALGDVRVRQAINLVFDREGIAAGLYAGDADPTTQIFNPEATAYDPDLDGQYPFDVDAAKALMAEAGYASGFDVEIPSQSPDTDSINPLVVQQLALLGIRVTEVPLTGPTATSEILGGRFAMFFAQISTADSLFDIVQSLEPGSIWNPFRSSDPALQPLLDQAQTAQGEAADEVYRQINRFVVEQAWFAPFVATKNYFALTSADLVSESTDMFRLAPHLWDFQ